MLYVADAQVFNAGILDDRRRMVNPRIIAGLKIKANRRVDSNSSRFDLRYRAAKRDASDAGVVFLPYAAHIYLVDKRPGEACCNNDVVSDGKAGRALDGDAVGWRQYVRAEIDRRADNVFPSATGGVTNANDDFAAHVCRRIEQEGLADTRAAQDDVAVSQAQSRISFGYECGMCLRCRYTTPPVAPAASIARCMAVVESRVPVGSAP